MNHGHRGNTHKYKKDVKNNKLIISWNEEIRVVWIEIGGQRVGFLKSGSRSDEFIVMNKAVTTAEGGRAEK